MLKTRILLAYVIQASDILCSRIDVLQTLPNSLCRSKVHQSDPNAGLILESMRDDQIILLIPRLAETVKVVDVVEPSELVVSLAVVIEEGVGLSDKR